MSPPARSGAHEMGLPGIEDTNSLAALTDRWHRDAASAELQGEQFDSAGAIGTGAYWQGRVDALRDAAQELAALAVTTREG